MTFEQLEAIVAVEREGTILATAESLNISHPSISRAISTLEDELSTVEHENAQLHERVAQQAGEATARNNAQDAPNDPKTAAEIIAARFTGLDGVTTTIQGAHTASPVVWISGDTDKHADEIKAAGAKWSGKRSAFYVRVA